jgi:hypothetical protein
MAPETYIISRLMTTIPSRVIHRLIVVDFQYVAFPTYISFISIIIKRNTNNFTSKSAAIISNKEDHTTEEVNNAKKM